MKIDKKEFLAWYFCGSDQEVDDLLLHIGLEAQDNLMDRGTYTINVDDLIRECGDVFLEEKNN